jgi:hypothetical protein
MNKYEIVYTNTLRHHPLYLLLNYAALLRPVAPRFGKEGIEGKTVNLPLRFGIIDGDCLHLKGGVARSLIKV